MPVLRSAARSWLWPLGGNRTTFPTQQARGGAGRGRAVRTRSANQSVRPGRLLTREGATVWVPHEGQGDGWLQGHEAAGRVGGACGQGQAGIARGLAVPVHRGCTVPGPALTPAPEHPGAGDPCLNPGKPLEPGAGELTPPQGPAQGQRAVFSDGTGCGSEHPRCGPVFPASWLGQSRVYFRPGFENPVRTASGHRARWWTRTMSASVLRARGLHRWRGVVTVTERPWVSQGWFWKLGRQRMSDPVPFGDFEASLPKLPPSSLPPVSVCFAPHPALWQRAPRL